jgi:hypothetical protein
MDKERFTERILETENLTDELEDADASWLLDWGIARLDQVLEGAQDQETAGSRVNALMAVMRKINRIVGSYADKSPQRLAQDLAELRDLFSTAFSSAGRPAAPPSEPESTPPALESQPAGPQQPSTPDAAQPAEASAPPESPRLPKLFQNVLRWLTGREPSPHPAASRPSSADDLTPAVDHLTQLSPTEALHYLAQDFFPHP